MKFKKTLFALGLAGLLVAAPAAAQDVRGNNFDLGDVVGILGGGGGGYYPNGQRSGIDVSDILGIASIIYQVSQQNKQPAYYPPYQYPQQYPGNYPYPQQYPNYPNQYPSNAPYPNYPQTYPGNYPYYPNGY